MGCGWKPLRSEKERLNDGAAMTPCGEFAYMTGCDDEPEGKDEASDERATCMLRRRATGGWATAGGAAHGRRQEQQAAGRGAGAAARGEGA